MKINKEDIDCIVAVIGLIVAVGALLTIILL